MLQSGHYCPRSTLDNDRTGQASGFALQHIFVSQASILATTAFVTTFMSEEEFSRTTTLSQNHPTVVSEGLVEVHRECKWLPRR